MFLKEARSKISSVLVFTLLFSLLLPALAWGAAAVPLKDIADSYAQKEIQSLVDSGIISGYEDGSFQPRKSITRAELAKILVLSLGLKENPDQAAAFTDVDKNSWYRGFVGALVQSNITQGNSATTFAPDAKVTREELAVFFIRALGLEETATKVAVDAKVSDLNTISDWAKAHVSLAFKVGFLQGIDDGAGSVKFSPKDNSERQAVARLAYEFKNNKDTIITKAKALAVGTLAVSSAVVTNNTTVEVTFNQAVGTVSASDFTFDNSLTVTKAELKSGSTTVVVLTTSVQTGGTVYKLSYLGKDTGITVTGAATGGSGSSSSGSSNNSVADKQLLANGGITYKNIRLTASDTYGPADGSKTIVKGTLTLDPGETGEITLRNIEADNIVVASGSPNSIKLVNIVIVVELKIDTNASQTALVRVVTEGTTVIASTYVGSGAIIEATKGSFGNINIGAGAAGKEVQLRGTITDAVYVTSLAVNVTINVNAPTTGGGSTSVAALNLGANTNVKTQTGSTLKSLVVTANIKVSLDGAGTISKVSASSTVPSFALNVSSTVNIVAFTVTITIILTGDTDKVAAISIIISVGGGKVEVSPDNADVNATKDALAIGYANGDSATSVKSNLNLPTTGVNGTTVTWSSSNTAVVGNDGTITRPTADTSVTLTATISKGSITATKAFTVLVKAIGNSETAVAASINALAIDYANGDSATSVTQNLTLATTDAANGTTITWSSSNTAVVSNTGVVVRQAADTVVTLTATVSSGSNSGTKEFQVTVKASNSVTTVTYLTYNTTATVSGVVYGKPGANGTSADALHIAAGNAADYLIVGFSENLSTTLDFSGATFTSNGTAVTATYTVIDTTYAAFKYSATRSPGEYKLEINGLKNKANGSSYNTVTFYVYQD
ncbi:S-layer homology domain-containing protein [Paenibacillus sp. WQ 127069]|uniref:S-layer homology domain-containing protein n=1 Tax=Paenibacillus baimaensis TaxID=2982185 RepID=A0ABT2UE31_9BACL|nr:immunoglobulin-like domain-containing protein [Paenibacillus sp. WQ 127069]MCU6792902.1 S-layer homology domain-containing protein [Paenibacillus sp. WQ 127069]